MFFTRVQKQAIVSLMIEMVNVDHSIAVEELMVTNDLVDRFCISDEEFSVGRALDPVYALSIIERMTDDQKLEVANALVEIIDADGIDTDEEIQLFNFICYSTGLDKIIENLSSDDKDKS